MQTFNREALEKLMAQRNLNKKQLAERIGVSRATVTRILQGEFQPSSKFLMLLKQKFPEVSLDFFYKE